MSPIKVAAWGLAQLENMLLLLDGSRVIRLSVLLL